MGLFKQKIEVCVTKPNYVIEKITIDDIKKRNISMYVKAGEVAILPTLNMEFPGQPLPYELKRENFVQVKGDSCDFFVYKDKSVLIPLPFFGGQFQIAIGNSGVKGTFALAGTAYLEIFDRQMLATHYGRSITVEEIQEDLTENYRSMLSNEISSIAHSFIKDDANETSFAASVRDIIREVIDDGKQTSGLFRKLGIRISKNGTSMHVNALDDAAEKSKLINDKLLESALFDMDENVRAAKKDEEERARQFEINKIKAGNSRSSETTTNINSNVPVTGVRKEPDVKQAFSFCPKCGSKITFEGAVFCPKCGTRLGE